MVQLISYEIIIHNVKLFKTSIVNIPKLILNESNYTHVYITPKGKSFRSVTTMLNKTKSDFDKKRLQRWKNDIGHEVANYIFETSGVIGTQTHSLNEDYLNMDVIEHDYFLLSYAHHRNFIPYLNKISNIYGIEAKLYSDSMGLAGTVDGVVMYDGKLSIIDYKTKRSKQDKLWMTDYFIQTTAYAKMWEELTGQVIENLVILASSEKNTIQEFVSQPHIHLNQLKIRIKLFNNTSHL